MASLTEEKGQKISAGDNLAHNEMAAEKGASLDVDVYGEDDPVEVAKITRKVDYRLLPVLAILYLLSFLDRGNSEFTCLELAYRH